MTSFKILSVALILACTPQTFASSNLFYPNRNTSSLGSSALEPDVATSINGVLAIERFSSNSFNGLPSNFWEKIILSTNYEETDFIRLSFLHLKPGGELIIKNTEANTAIVDADIDRYKTTLMSVMNSLHEIISQKELPEVSAEIRSGVKKSIKLISGIFSKEKIMKLLQVLKTAEFKDPDTFTEEDIKDAESEFKWKIDNSEQYLAALIFGVFPRVRTSFKECMMTLVDNDYGSAFLFTYSLHSCLREAGFEDVAFEKLVSISELDDYMWPSLITAKKPSAIMSASMSSSVIFADV